MADSSKQRIPGGIFEIEFPGTVRLAGTIWIFVGLFVPSMAIGNLFLLGGLALSTRNAQILGNLVGNAIIALIVGLAFLFVGVQSVRGTARDTLGNGIGSIIFGLLNIGGAVLVANSGLLIAAALSVLFSLGLISAGVLALSGRDDYRNWRTIERSKKSN